MRRKGRKPDRKYLEWIRGLPCAACAGNCQFCRAGVGLIPHSDGTERACDQRTRSEAAHVGDRGLGQKCSDRETIPLCAEHHRTGPAAHHKLGKRFWAHHRLDKAALIAELNRRYELEAGGVPGNG